MKKLIYGLMLISLTACGETNESSKPKTSESETSQSAPQKQDLDEAKIISFFKSLDYARIPWSDKIVKVKEVDEITTTYKFDFSGMKEDDLIYKFNTSSPDVPQCEFTVINNRVISANYSIHAAPGDNTDGLLQNTTGDLIIKETQGGVYGSTAYTFKNGKKIEEIEFQESEQQKAEKYIKGISSSKKTVAANESIDIESSSSLCFIRDFFYKNGNLYIKVDYVNSKYVEGENADYLEIINNNPKLRTFKVKKGIKTYCAGGSRTDIKKYLKENNPMKRNKELNDGYNATFEVVVKNGIVVDIKNLWCIG